LTSYLYVLSIGPVQDFISAARRTRDLWFGSHLLSEISKAAARTVAEAEGNLIFPALKCGDPDLESAYKLPLDKRIYAFNVANVVLAELPDGIKLKPSEINLQAKIAAQKEWMHYAEEARDRAGSPIRPEIWNDQIDDVIEFYAAWTPLTDDYQDTRSRVMRLLAGRKSIRDFKPAMGRPGIPKSSLDGARESVFQKDHSIPKKLSFQMRLNEGEQLCAIGLTKRIGGQRIAFPSVIRVALDPWMRGIARDQNDEASRIVNEIKILCNGENSFSTGTGKRLYQNFPFDGQIFYSSRLSRAREILKETPIDPDEEILIKGDLEKLDLIEMKTIELQKRFGEPNPYLAILVADGDRMGKALSNIKSMTKHKEFSGQLAKFATEARRIVEEDHQGCMVYSGGDDVLAFIPVDHCLEAARDLHDAFENLLKDSSKDLGGETPTLSVGIAIGHSMEPLEDLLEFGRSAERSAKYPDRNGLSVNLHTRSGGDPVKLREQWKPAGQNGLDERLGEWVEMYDLDKFPDKAAYDLRLLAEDYKDWVVVSQNLISKDVERLLRQKRSGHGANEIGKADIDKLMKDVTSHDDLVRRAEELVLARSVAEVKRQTHDQIKTEESA
jgi:CRISPR-associated protein Cmr2